MVQVEENNNSIDQLQLVRESMRPWVYRLVEQCMEKAIFDYDEHALNAFLYVCDETVLFTKSDVEQFEEVRSRLTESPHREHYITAIHNAFTSVYGDVEGF